MLKPDASKSIHQNGLQATGIRSNGDGNGDGSSIFEASLQTKGGTIGTKNNDSSLIDGKLLDNDREDADSNKANSLANYVATGTTAGLLFNDLMAQANVQSKSPPESMYHADNGDDENISTTKVVNQVTSNSGINRPIEQQQTMDVDQLRQQLEMLANNPNQVDLDSQTSRNNDDKIADIGLEDQMPDNIESLLRSEGINTSDSSDDEEASSADESNGKADANIQQQPHLAANDNRLIMINPSVASQSLSTVYPGTSGGNNHEQIGASGVTSNHNNESDNDDDEHDGADEDNDISNANDLGQQQLQATQANQLTSSPTFSRDPLAMELTRQSLTDGFDDPNIGRSSMAPIRNSLIDLNTAAGHYYGKKKKKKKIIIKKKKKVIKKKKKKKVKIVKIYKSKKPKKMMHHDHGKYYMYAKVPKKKSWEFGFKKGNKKHWIERHEKGHKNKFKTKVRWYDKKSKGKGFHIWDYNHYDKKKKKHH